MKIDYTKLLIKAHFFFFMASGGSVFPFLFVYGKQIGISPLIIGSINAISPFLHLIAKPIFGFIMDSSQAWRKVIFISLLIIGNSCYVMVFFLPSLPGLMPSEYHFQNISCNITLPLCDMEYQTSAIKSCNDMKNITCHWICKDINSSMQLSFHVDQKTAIISSDTTCLLNITETLLCQGNVANYNCNVTCDNFNNDECQYTSIIFWSFVLLICFGETGFFIFISLSDTICFLILGKGEQLKYGRQRLWGTIGFGSAACLTGYMIDLWSQGKAYKIYTPSILLTIIFTCIDLICCIKLKVPFEAESTTILKDVFTFLKSKSIIIFLCFVTCVGVINSFIRNFLFWYLEDLAIETGYMNNIKLIEGLVTGMQTFGGEMVFFFLSGKILKRLGYGYTIIFCFICYAIRLALISLAPMPWWVLPIECLQGPTYALYLTTIVAYASVIAPPGASGTIQGLVQSLDNGFGMSVSSLISGILYKKFGGTITVRFFSVFAIFAALTYFILHTVYLKHKTIDARSNIIIYRKPGDRQDHHCVAEDI